MWLRVSLGVSLGVALRERSYVEAHWTDAQGMQVR